MQHTRSAAYECHVFAGSSTTAGYKYMHSQPLLMLAQGRIEEWIREWRLSSAESRDLYLETAALLRTNKVGNRVPIMKLISPGDKAQTH